ncbi:MAG: TIGR02996 domain-containing protein [Fimbriiglobus sp.]
MSPDHAGLLAAVLANPDDDLPRLVFADFLEETGVPANVARAAYLRGQIEAEVHPPGTGPRLEWNRRLAGLRDRFRDEWDAAFADPTDWHGFRVERRRGFVDEVAVGLPRFTQLGRRMFAAAPVRVLRITDGGEPEQWQAFGNADFLGGLRVLQVGPRVLELRVHFDLREATEFFPRPAHRAFAALRLDRLTRFDLSNNNLDMVDVQVLLDAVPIGAFPLLTEIDLSNNQLTPDGKAAIRDRYRDRFGDRVIM